MNEIHPKLGALLRLKRHELPPAGYFEDFLREFQSRRRSELTSQPGWRLGWERLQDWFADLGRVRWAYAAGLSYAALLLGLFFWPHSEPQTSLPAAPVVHELPAPSPNDAGALLDLRGAAEDEFSEQEF